MPKNKGRGGKKFRSGKKSTDGTARRQLELKEKDQEYARVEKMLGNRRLLAITNDDRQILCHIPGKFKSRVWINVGDVILITIRQYQDDRSDVIYKYDQHEIKQLSRLTVERGGLSDKIKDIDDDFQDDEIISIEEKSEEELDNRPPVEYPSEESEESEEIDSNINIDDL